MAVSTDQTLKIQEILQQLDEHLEHPSSENRKAARVKVRTPLTVILLTGNAPSPVEVFSRNISFSGMGFVSRRMFRQEERLAISLRIPKLPAKLILARVTFGRYVRNGLYEMGVEFLESVPDPNGAAIIPRSWILGASAAMQNPPAPAAAKPARPAPVAQVAAPAAE